MTTGTERKERIRKNIVAKTHEVECLREELRTAQLELREFLMNDSVDPEDRVDFIRIMMLQNDACRARNRLEEAKNDLRLLKSISRGYSL